MNYYDPDDDTARVIKLKTIIFKKRYVLISLVGENSFRVRLVTVPNAILTYTRLYLMRALLNNNTFDACTCFMNSTFGRVPYSFNK